MLASFRSRPLAQQVVIILGFIAGIIHVCVIAVLRVPYFRDFDVHREVGRRFLAGEYLYTDGLCYPYMPSAALYFAPLALLDRGAGIALRYTVAVLCLYLTLFLLYRMVRDRSKVTPTQGFWIGAATVLLISQFMVQDLDDGGPHLILLAILTSGIYAVWQGREKLGAMGFGLAIALKVSPALFLPFFLWKRQWRLAGFAALAASFWILLPMVWMGPGSWWSHQREWVMVAAGSSIGQETPITVENEQRVRNQSLEQTLTRFLVTLPQDHPLRREDPGYLPILNLPPPTAKLVIIAVMMGMVSALCWYARHPFEGRGDPAWLRETSVVMILALLFSPVTWVQHLVWLAPALYLILVDVRSNAGVGTPTKIALATYVALTLVFNYEVLGKRTFALVLSYHPFTVALLLVLGMLMVPRQTSETVCIPADRHEAASAT